MTVDLSRLWAAIAVSGEDSRSFLHAQVTTDVNGQDEDHARFSAWLSPKGRVIAQLCIIPQDERWIVLTHPSLVDSVVRRLGLYVLRARVTLAAAAALPVTGRYAPAPPRPPGDPLPLLSRSPLAIGWPGGRQLVVGDTTTGDNGGAAERWLAEDVALGIPHITAATSERHVAHAIGLERLGAISYRKGCYPGQEIVARTHYLGRVKRQARRYRCEAPPPEAGTALTRDGKAAGEVLMAAPGPEASEVLAVVSDTLAELTLNDELGRSYHPVALASD